MLEKPDLTDEALVDYLLGDYGIVTAQISFLPVGADVNAAAYRVVSNEGRAYFLKLKRAGFDEISVALPAWLADMGLRQIIPPLVNQSGRCWSSLAAFKTILYPFVEGSDGYEQSLSDRQCVEFGTTMAAVHAAALPLSIKGQLRQETFSPKWRAMVRSYMDQIEQQQFQEPTAAALAAFLFTERPAINELVERAEGLGRALAARNLPQVLCHGDAHPGNVLLTPDDRLYLVDWDELCLAPKERDLMCVGMGGVWPPGAADVLFYAGYGPAEIDRPALAYFCCERVVQDFAVVCREILSTEDGGANREQSLGFLVDTFEPGKTGAVALQTAASLDKAAG